MAFAIEPRQKTHDTAAMEAGKLPNKVGALNIHVYYVRRTSDLQCAATDSVVRMPT